MQYLIVFLEGITTFISPCLLPMIPIYISYFAAGNHTNKKQTFKNALGFVLGFTIVFTALGAFAGTLGTLLRQYSVAVNIVTGLIVIVFGLNFLGVFKFNLFRGGAGTGGNTKQNGFFSSVLFGMVFSVGWTPCVGAFLGSALMLASQQGSVWLGIVMLLCYSLGLGIPFLVSAVLIEKLTTAFNFIKRHYRVINIVSGIFLILVGILMMTGTLGYLLSFLSF
ncbi:cytochrome c biogenesis CcdA family protein [Ruminococcaceae bacterium OttesenSCG-928-A16]|nr:cytochrome c biogenesis CcdA family protein [Ruminococcaceae bacterium OttesenSCG-928-A16]